MHVGVRGRERSALVPSPPWALHPLSGSGHLQQAWQRVQRPSPGGREPPAWPQQQAPAAVFCWGSSPALRARLSNTYRAPTEIRAALFILLRPLVGLARQSSPGGTAVVTNGAPSDIRAAMFILLRPLVGLARQSVDLVSAVCRADPILAMCRSHHCHVPISSSPCADPIIAVC